MPGRDQALCDLTDLRGGDLGRVIGRAEADASSGSVHDVRPGSETAAARVLAEESNAASISATDALSASTVQVETLTLRVTDAENTEAELQAELGERASQIEALQADAEAAARSLAELTATAEEWRAERDQLRQVVGRLEGEIHDARQAVATAEQERTDAEEAAERDREVRIRAERESAESHARVEAAETLSAAHQDS